IQAEVAQVIVVDDGNDASYDSLFNQIATIDRCIVLYHDENMGKGAALKTAIRYFLAYFSNLNGLITADVDAQHLIEDVLNVGNHLENMSDGIILGSRVYDSNNMPTRSLIGNTVTSRVFQLLFGLYLRDTQTGLRGITT